jgi:hypothetical protein
MKTVAEPAASYALGTLDSGSYAQKPDPTHAFFSCLPFGHDRDLLRNQKYKRNTYYDNEAAKK